MTFRGASGFPSDHNCRFTFQASIPSWMIKIGVPIPCHVWSAPFRSILAGGVFMFLHGFWWRKDGLDCACPIFVGKGYPTISDDFRKTQWTPFKFLSKGVHWRNSHPPRRCSARNELCSRALDSSQHERCACSVLVSLFWSRCFGWIEHQHAQHYICIKQPCNKTKCFIFIKFALKNPKKACTIVHVTCTCIEQDK